MAQTLPRVEYLVGYEGDAFSSTGDVRRDLLSITAVHPMRESAISELLDRTNAEWMLVEDMIDNGELRKVEYLGEHYYLRRYHSVPGNNKNRD
jgi:hypothetical protein